MRITKIIQNNPFYNGFIACLLIPTCVQAGLNKWQDEKGQVHYGDRVPAEYLRKEHSELNEHGVTVKTSEAMKTEAELNEQQKKLNIEAAEKTRRIIAERKKTLRDRVLLDTFTTQADLILAREARIEALDSQIALAQTLIKNDEMKFQKAKDRIASLEKAGRKPPDNLLKQMTLVGRQIETNYEYVKDKKKERAEILKTFEQDVKRFNELMIIRQKVKDKRANEVIQ